MTFLFTFRKRNFCFLRLTFYVREFQKTVAYLITYFRHLPCNVLCTFYAKSFSLCTTVSCFFFLSFSQALMLKVPGFHLVIMLYRCNETVFGTHEIAHELWACDAWDARVTVRAFIILIFASVASTPAILYLLNFVRKLKELLFFLTGLYTSSGM